jgi:hypothetical protein
LAVRLDIFTGGDSSAGYAEARVTHRTETDNEDTRGVLYDLLKQLLDAMNVELEFQVRRSLQSFIVSAPNAAPQPVQQQNLTPPS